LSHSERYEINVSILRLYLITVIEIFNIRIAFKRGEEMMKRYFISIVIILSLIISAGCTNSQQKNSEGNEKHTAAMGDIAEETSSVNKLPTFLQDQSDNIKTIYQASAVSQELLEKIPCYCGCGESVGHKSNYDCFIRENKKNGGVVWDSHGVNCDVCLETAAQSITDYQSGKSIKDIRKEIDQKYKEGYAKPTPTPQV